MTSDIADPALRECPDAECCERRYSQIALDFHILNEHGGVIR